MDVWNFIYPRAENELLLPKLMVSSRLILPTFQPQRKSAFHIFTICKAKLEGKPKKIVIVLKCSNCKHSVLRGIIKYPMSLLGMGLHRIHIPN